MKTDGITLLDDTEVKKQQSEKFGVTFPSNPKSGDVWDLTEDIVGYKKGEYTFDGIDWIPIDFNALYPQDIGLNVFGDLPSNKVISRFLVNRTMKLNANLDASLAMVGVAPPVQTTLDVAVTRRGETEATVIAQFVIEADQNYATVVNAPQHETVLSVGDLIDIRAQSMPPGVRDFSATIAGQLVK